MKILFFGGTGLIGKNFYKFCKYKNFKIDIVSRKKPQFKLRKTDNWFSVLQNLIKGNLSKINIDSLSKKENKELSKFLYHKLCYYFEGFERIKSFQVIKDIFYNG